MSSEDGINTIDPFPGISDEELALGVYLGKYGNGSARKKALGSRYDDVQKVVTKYSGNTRELKKIVAEQKKVNPTTGNPTTGNPTTNNPADVKPTTVKKMYISYEKMNEVIVNLNNAASRLENAKSVIKSNVEKGSQHENSGKYAGDVGMMAEMNRSFTKKYTKLDIYLESAIESVRLLASTYQKASDLIAEKQNQAKQALNDL